MLTMGKPLKMGGTAWKYLVESVTAGIGEVRLGADSARYYAAKGTPPGRFLGRGLSGLGEQPGSVKVGDQVSPEMLHRMLAQLADPITGQTLGRPPALGKRPPVAGFDMTFSPPKSVSVMWAMADRGTKTVIEDIMVQALSEVMGWAEDRVFRTRTGTQGVRSEPVRGVVASAWMHYESRDGDPQLHHHVVVLNRAQAVSDGRWRTLDSRGLHPWIVALSERHVGLVEDLMSERFGLAWKEMATVAGRDLKREVEGVPVDLIGEFSRRTQAIESLIAVKVAEFETARGRAPTNTELARIHRLAWGQTRRAKTHRSLREMTDEWTARARPWVGNQPASWVATLCGRADLPVLRSDDLTDDMLADVARAALNARSESHSVFTPANIYADVERQLHGIRFARGERAKVADRAVGCGLGMAVKLTAPEMLHVPERFRSPDGVSQFAPAAGWQYTTQDLLDAEARLLDAGRDTGGPTVSYATIAAVCDRALSGRTYGLGADQAVAVEQIAASGRSLDLLVGPAGTGKTTTLAGLLVAWETEHGADSVRGLAPSAAAAANLAEELGIPCENTAKWLTEVDRQDARQAEIARLRARLRSHQPQPVRRSVTERIATLDQEVKRWDLHPGDLLVIDEAGMAGTFALDRLAAQAGEAGAKLLLVGDWAQLAAVDAGGAFGMLVDDRAVVPELSEVRRFQSRWERRASVELRTGSSAGVDAYLAHERVADGNRAAMLDAIYQAWRTDTEAGQTSLMIAYDVATVAELNQRARQDRASSGQVMRAGVQLADGLDAGVGDVVVTRRNDRRLRLVDGEWVRNRDRWTVTGTHQDGSMTVRHADNHGQVVLPADYVAEHVELGYASTAYSTQGRTVDTAHALIGISMTREVLYESATRGRLSNHLYVDVQPEPAGADMTHGPAEHLDVRDVLLTVAARRGSELSAHQTMVAEWAKATGFEQLAKEHQTLVADATTQQWDRVMDRAGLSADVLFRARQSPDWVGLLGDLRDVDRRGLDVDAALPHLATGRPILPDDDPATVLRGRLRRWETASGGRWQSSQDMVAGLVSRTSSITDSDLGRAIRQREDAIIDRARTLAEHAVGTGAPWTRAFGPPPADPARSSAWWDRLAIIATYRDRWDITAQKALGVKDKVRSAQQAAHRARALRAGMEALQLAGLTSDATAPGPLQPWPDIDRGVTL
jgi:conjugative relaxase-like TrwC/TraI family protein